MKQLVQTLLIAIMIMASGTMAMAQTGNMQKLSREELAVKQAQYIAHELALDEAASDKYVEVYCQYQRDLWNIGPRKSLTTEQMFDRSQQILDLRKKYYKKYKSFMTERQIEQAYKLEKRLLNRLMHKSKSQKRTIHR